MTEATKRPGRAMLIAVILGAVILGGLFWAAASINRPAAAPRPTPTATTTTAATAKPTDGSVSSPSPTPTTMAPVIPLPDEIGTRATVGASAAAHFIGTDPKSLREADYAKAGFTPELVAGFTPIWTTIFDTPSVSKTTVKATGETLFAASAEVQGTSNIRALSVWSRPGEPQVYVVSVDVLCAPQWRTPTGQLVNGGTFTAAWLVTINEAGAISEIQQPRADKIPVHPGS